jgi:hypothetical protein
MTASFWQWAVGVVVGFALLSRGEASARGFVIVTWGDTISHVGDAPAQTKQSHGSSQVGYKYGYFGVFWIDLWTHSGTYCVYDGRMYTPIASAEAARLLGKSESELSTPFLYRWPLGWMIFGPLIVIGIISEALSKRGRNEVAEPFHVAQYRRALEILNERYAASAGAAPTGAAGDEPAPADERARFQAAFRAAVEYLVGTGMSREEAEHNLAIMVHELALTGQQNRREERPPPSLQTEERRTEPVPDDGTALVEAAEACYREEKVDQAIGLCEGILATAAYQKYHERCKRYLESLRKKEARRAQQAEQLYDSSSLSKRTSDDHA